MNAPTDRDVKRLYALSNRRCAFPNCTTPIVQPSGTITGEICHIRAKGPKGPRYDPKQTDEERHAFDNLILLCSMLKEASRCETKPEYSTCSCRSCGQHLEFPTRGTGMTIKCPTCQQDTVLYREDQSK